MTPARKRILRRTIFTILTLGLFLCLALAALFLYPEPFFAHRAEYGNLSLHSDLPFVAEDSAAVLRQVEERLETSPLYSRDRHYRVFVCNESWRRALYFLPVSKARGISYMSSTAVFLSGGDINRNLLIPPGGIPDTTGPRLSYYVAHEITHVVTERTTGPVDYLHLPDWIREGYADYVARGSLLESAHMREAFLKNAPEMNFPAIAPYLRYNLLVAHYLENRHLTPEQFFDAAPDQKTAEAELRQVLLR